MATWDYELVSPPPGARARELWIQHSAGFILLEDVRRAALNDLPASLSKAERAVAEKAVESTILNLMAVVDHVKGSLRNDSESVRLSMVVTYTKAADSSEGKDEAYSLDLFLGDGVSMGIHGWLENDFGDHPVAVRKLRS